MTRSDLDHLGEHAVYPGHPVTVAYLILKEYAGRLDEAFAEGLEFPGALENGRIPGAGGNVYLGLSVVERARDGLELAGLLSWADDAWAACDDQAKGGYPSNGKHDPERMKARWREGQEQADRIKPKLVEMLREVAP